MTSAPQVSVLLAVHNGAAFLEEALRSILRQSLAEIEIIAVDDGSRDQSPALLARLAREDSRLRVVTLANNQGLPAALNQGLHVARADLVARMDADDIAHPDRLRRQKAYLDQHPEVVALGSSFRRITAKGAVTHVTHAPWTPAQLAWRSRFRVPFQHPTAMFRRCPAGAPIYYDPAFSLCEDVEFWSRIQAHGALACLPDVLLDYREHGGNITKTRWHAQIAQADRARRAFLAQSLPPPVVAALEPSLRAFAGQAFSGQKAEHSPQAIVQGLRVMLEHDLATQPQDAGFLRRQTAQLALQCLRRAGLRPAAAIAALLRHDPRLILPLAQRLWEVKRQASEVPHAT